MFVINVVRLTQATRQIHVTGHSVLSSAAVLQSNRYPRKNVIMQPIQDAVHASDDMDPLSLGSVISPTYDRMGASLNPMLKPISTVDAYSMTEELVWYSSIHPRMLGTFASIMHRLRPYLSCRKPDMKLPAGWNTNNILPIRKQYNTVFFHRTCVVLFI